MINRRAFCCGLRYRLPLLPLRSYLGLAPPPPAHPLAMLNLLLVSFGLCVSHIVSAHSRICSGSACPPSSLVPFVVPIRLAFARLGSVRQAHNPPTPTLFCWLGALARVSRSAYSIRRNCRGRRLPCPAPAPRACAPPLCYGLAHPLRSAVKKRGEHIVG